MTRLLILACSARKKGYCAKAIDVYDGPTFRVLRKALADGVDDVEVYVLSAKYGLLPGQLRIAPYDREMTPQRAQELRPLLEINIEELAVDISPDRVRDGDSFSEVYIEVGQVYRWALPCDEDLARAFGCPIHWGSGGIGTRCRKLKAWLRKNLDSGPAKPAVEMKLI